MGKGKIIIVEDEVIVAEMLKTFLERKGYIVPSIASTGKEAISRAKKFKPDLMIMDIGLEGEMDGIEAADEIRSKFGISVIFLTAFEDENTFKRAKITEPFGYIVKPFQEREILMAIEIALYKNKMEKERQKHLDEIKVLRGCLPICAYCKKIRDGKGEWEEVADYIREHSEAEFTHCICPECEKKLFTEMDETNKS